jgi:hypothetical protein
VAFSAEIAGNLQLAPQRSFANEINGNIGQAPLRSFASEIGGNLSQTPMHSFSSEVSAPLTQLSPSNFSTEIDAFLEQTSHHSFSIESIAEQNPFLNNIRLLRIDQVRGSLISVRRAVDMNTTTDQPVSIGPKNYIIRRVIVTNASVPLTTAVGGIYTGPGKTGTAIVPASQAYSALTSSTKFLDTGQHISTITDTFVTDPLYFSLTTPQGVAATVDIYIYGDSVEP